MANRKSATARRKATGSTASVSTGAISGAARVPLRPVRPPLESALDDVARELRAALDGAQAQIAGLKTELAALKTELATFKQTYRQHTHAYAHGNPGSGGLMWFSLGQMRSYFDDDKTIWDGQGVYLRGGPVTGSPTAPQTKPPSP